MIILPAIDIIDRKPVRLYQGDYAQKEIVGSSVMELAKNFEEPETVAFINGVLGGFMREEYGAADDIAAAVEAGGESAN